MIRTAEPPSFDEFRENYRDFLPQAPEPRLASVTGQQLYDDYKKRPTKQSGGFDGFTTLECKALPPSVLDLFAMIFDSIEIDEQAEWPASFVHVPMVSLRKGQDRTALDLRLLTLMSALYSAWANVRYNDDAMLRWRASWKPEQLRGATIDARSQDISFALCQLVEWATMCEADVAAVFLDRVKCFDRIVRNLALELAKYAGCPSRIGAARETWYRVHRRYFRVGKAYSWALTNDNGMAQGCVWSLDDISLIMAVWVRQLASRVPRVLTAVFVDDSSLACYGQWVEQDMQEALALTYIFDQWTLQQVHPAKTVVLSARGEAAKELDLRFNDKVLKTSAGAKLVGDYILFGQEITTAASDKRFLEAMGPLRRIARAPVTLEVRAQLAQTFGPAKATHGSETLWPSTAMMTQYDGAVRQAVVGFRFWQPWLSKDVLFSLIVRGHAILAQPTIQRRVFDILVHQLRTSNLARRRHMEIWDDRNLRQTHGPVSHMSQVVQQLRWTWEGPFLIETDFGYKVDILKTPRLFIHHWLRETFRRQQWMKILVKRHDLGGIQDYTGVDVFATTYRLRGRHLPKAWECDHRTGKGLLRQAMLGAIHTLQRLSRARFAVDDRPQCLYCNGEEETAEHIYFCSCWRDELGDDLRRLTTQDQRMNWRPATRHCESFFLQEAWLAQQLKFGLEEAEKYWPHPVQEEDNDLETYEGSHLVAGTDGACSDAAVPLLRRAGSGVSFGRGHSQNYSGWLPGAFQTAQRAEVYAIDILCCKIVWRPTLILTDSRYVKRIMDRLLQGAKVGDGAHYDLWYDIHRAIHVHPQDFFRVRWIKAHTQPSDIDSGIIAFHEHVLNEEADELAVAGARERCWPARLRTEILKQLSLANCYHDLMVNSLYRRMHRLPHASRQAGFCGG